MKTDLLFKYLKSRAQIEGVGFDLSQETFFEPLFKKGVRNFFGVNVNNHGFPYIDEQEPKEYEGLLCSFINLQLDKGESSVIRKKELIDYHFTINSD